MGATDNLNLTTCLERTTTSSQGVINTPDSTVTVSAEKPEELGKHPIHVPPRPAMLAALAILAREEGQKAYDQLSADMYDYEVRELRALNDHGRGLWSESVPGTIRPDLPALMDISRFKELRRQVREAGAPWRNLAQNMATCGLDSKYFSCRNCGPHQEPVILPILCMSRYCRHCSKAKRSRSRARAEAVVGRFAYRIRFLTLTIRSTASLEKSTSQLRRSLTKLRRRKFWREHIEGGLVTIESVINKAGFHPHAHMLFDGSFVRQPRMVDEWMSVNGCRCARSRDPNRKAVMCCREAWADTKDKYDRCADPACLCEGSAAGPAGVNVKAMPSQKDAVREICKYAAKELGACRAKGSDGKYRDMTAEETAEFLRHTVGRRLLMTFGTHYDLEHELAEAIAAEETEPQAGPLPKCESCGETEYTFVGISPTPISAKKNPCEEKTKDHRRLSVMIADTS